MINVACPSRKPQAYAIAGRLGLGDVFRRHQASTEEKNFIRASGILCLPFKSK